MSEKLAGNDHNMVSRTEIEEPCANNTDKYCLVNRANPSRIPCRTSTTKLSGFFFGQTQAGNPDQIAEKMKTIEASAHEGFSLRVGHKDERIKGCLYTIELDDQMLSAKLTGFDRAVFDGVCSLFEAGIMSFTPKQVLETIAGKANKSKNDSVIVSKVIASIEKMAKTRVEFDWTDHAVMNKITVNNEQIEEFKVRSNLLYIDHATIKLQNGTVVDGFKLLKAPSLYTYSQSVHQVAALESTYLTIPGVYVSEKNIVITHYLARRIMQLKNKKGKNKLSEVIRMDTLFEQCSLIIHSRRDAKKAKDTIYNILNYYVSTGFISQYEKVCEGNSVVKVRVLCKRANGVNAEKR